MASKTNGCTPFPYPHCWPLSTCASPSTSTKREEEFANICKNIRTKERLSKKFRYLCFVLCVERTDILKRSANSLYSVDVKLDTLLRNIGIIRKGALLGCIRTRVPFCLVRAWCIRILHTSKRGCQFILSILQEVQAYIEDKTGFGGPALFVCPNLKIINRTGRAARGIKRNNYGKFSIFE